MRGKVVTLIVACWMLAIGAAWGAPEEPSPISPEYPEAAAPSLGKASLTVDEQVHLGAASSVFKDGSVFMWSGGADQNTALGTLALSSNTIGTGSTAVGYGALQANTGDPSFGSYNTAVGALALNANTTGDRNAATGFWALYRNTTGFDNAAWGYAALYSNRTGVLNTASGSITLSGNYSGSRNTASGAAAMFRNSTGSYNTASGFRALRNNTTGDRNAALGYRAGYNATIGDDNVFISHEGVAGESATVRIGTGGTHTRAFVAGISGTSVTGTNVVVNSSGQLGVFVSSARFKGEIEEMGEASTQLLALRPVKFRYKEEAIDGPRPVEFGLLAEEVAELYPNLVTYDEEGQPLTVRYHVLIPMLLNELQKQHAQLAELEHLKVRMERLEKIADRSPDHSAGEVPP